MDNPNRSFIYPELSGKERGFRLFHFVKGFEPQNGFQLSLNVESFNLDSAPMFTALSYTWSAPFATHGNDSKLPQGYWDTCNHRLLCNGQTFFIQQNLLDLLHALTTKLVNPDIDYFWLDVLCIHQNDLNERSSQVQLLGDIFHSAGLVACWLGRPDKHSNVARDLIDLMSPALEMLYEEHGKESLYFHLTSDELTDAVGTKTSLTPHQAFQKYYKRDLWDSFDQFMQRTWFHRGWIVQEFCLARTTLLLCGEWFPDIWQLELVASLWSNQRAFQDRFLLGAGLTWEPCAAAGFEDLRRVASWTSMVDKAALTDDPALLRGQRRYRDLPNAQEAVLFEILGDFHRWQTLLPQDKIFSLFGLVTKWAPPNGDPIFTPDYKLSFEQVFMITATRLIQKLPDLRCLSLVQDPARRKYSTLPSWVPNFASGDAHFTWKIKAGRAALHQTNCNGSRIIEGRRLSLDGLFVGTVTSLSDAREEPGVGKLLVSLSKSRHQLLLQIADTPYPVTGESAFEAFWRTLIYDKVGHTEHPPAKDLVEDIQRSYLIQLLDAHHAGDEEFLNLYAELRERAGAAGQLMSVASAMEYDRNFQEIPADLLKPLMMYLEDRAREFERQIQDMHRRVVLLSDGRLAMAPKSTRGGDEAWILRDGRVPFIFRRKSADSECFELMGEAFVYGVSFGEMVNEHTVWRRIVFE